MTKNTTATVETLTAEVRTLMVGSRQVTMSVYNQLDRAASARIEPFGRVATKDAARGYVYVVGKHSETGELVRCDLPTTAPLIAQWVSSWSATKRTRRAAEDKDGMRDTHLAKAEKCEQDAARKLDGGYSSAQKQDQDAADSEESAGRSDAEADTAETESEMLKARAAAARSRYDASTHRVSAADLRTEAARLQAEAVEHRAAAELADAEATKLWDEWQEQDAAEAEACPRVAAMAAEWSALPLIVLAGLR